MTINRSAIETFINHSYDSHIIPTLMEYIKIPNQSPHFDENWLQNGYMDRAIELVSSWCYAQNIENMLLEVVQLEGRTPLLFIEILGQSPETVLMYGHLDKQPEMTGWRSDLGPWKPVIEGDRLYGRGGADDGYAVFASLTAIKALQVEGIAHARCVVIIECCEESGSYDLPYYIEHLKSRIGVPSLVVCLDSGAGNYEQLWMTTSLRGNVVGNLSVEVIKEGIHSGNGSGIVADSFRIARHILSRIENSETGEVLLPELNQKIPAKRIDESLHCAEVLGNDVYSMFPFHPNVTPCNPNLSELILNRTWRPALTITGADGLPSTNHAGNVLRPKTTLKLSMRLPPEVDAKIAEATLSRALMTDAPYNAKITFDAIDANSGWNAPELSPWLETTCEEASEIYYGKPPVYMGEGGTIPFMGMLGKMFPNAQFVITGVLGPESNAHGPNEFLHIPMVKKLTACISYILNKHYLNFIK